MLSAHDLPVLNLLCLSVSFHFYSFLYYTSVQSSWACHINTSKVFTIFSITFFINWSNYRGILLVPLRHELNIFTNISLAYRVLCLMSSTVIRSRQGALLFFVSFRALCIYSTVISSICSRLFSKEIVCSVCICLFSSTRSLKFFFHAFLFMKESYTAFLLSCLLSCIWYHFPVFFAFPPIRLSISSYFFSHMSPFALSLCLHSQSYIYFPVLGALGAEPFFI